MERVADWVIVHSMVHIRSEQSDRTLCGLHCDELGVSAIKRATQGFCQKCQEKQQMPGMDLAL